MKLLTFFLKKSLSSRVKVSALAITGTMFTTLLRRLMNSTSKGLRLIKGKYSSIFCIAIFEWTLPKGEGNCFQEKYKKHIKYKKAIWAMFWCILVCIEAFLKILRNSINDVACLSPKPPLIYKLIM